MALFRRKPVLVGSLVTLLCTVSIVSAMHFMRSMYAPAPLMLYTEPPSYTPLDPLSATQIAEIRQAAGLDDDVLAACNFSDAELEELLAGLRNWYASNSAAWQRSVSAIADTRSLIRLYEGEISNGRDRTGARTEAITQLAALETERSTLLGDLRQVVLANASEGVRTLIEQMRTQSDVGFPYRALFLSSDQKTQLTTAIVRFNQRSAVTRDGDDRGQIEGEFDQELRSAIGQSNAQSLENLKSYLTAASERVVNAVQKVLPVEQQE